VKKPTVIFLELLRRHFDVTQASLETVFHEGVWPALHPRVAHVRTLLKQIHEVRV
jgi:hypothetical protein